MGPKNQAAMPANTVVVVVVVVILKARILGIWARQNRNRTTGGRRVHARLASIRGTFALVVADGHAVASLGRNPAKGANTKASGEAKLSHSGPAAFLLMNGANSAVIDIDLQ